MTMIERGPIHSKVVGQQKSMFTASDKSITNTLNLGVRIRGR